LRIVCARCLTDAMKYTIKDLIVQNGRIFRTEGAFAIPFMDTPPINVVAKETAAAARGSEREYCFNFRLNAPPDEMWQEILRSQLGNFGVAVSRNILQFATDPANLKSRYKTLKKAIVATNRLYAQKQQSLIAQIKEKDKQEAATAQRKQQSQEQAKKLFGELEL
jgi:hypothetical protein